MYLKLRIKITVLFIKYIYFLYSDLIASVSFPQFWRMVATLWLQCIRFSLQSLLLSCSPGSRACRLQQFHLLGSIALAHRLTCPSACGISDQEKTHMSCIAQWILYHTLQGGPHIFKYRCFIKIGRNLLYVIFCLYYFLFFLNQNKIRLRSSLVVQWLRMCLPMQGAWVPSQVQEDASEQRRPGAITT